MVVFNMLSSDTTEVKVLNHPIVVHDVELGNDRHGSWHVLVVLDLLLWQLPVWQELPLFPSLLVQLLVIVRLRDVLGLRLALVINPRCGVIFSVVLGVTKDMEDLLVDLGGVV